jgi:hypothetical protein
VTATGTRSKRNSGGTRVVSKLTDHSGQKLRTMEQWQQEGRGPNSKAVAKNGWVGRMSS